MSVEVEVVPAAGVYVPGQEVLDRREQIAIPPHGGPRLPAMKEGHKVEDLRIVFEVDGKRRKALDPKCLRRWPLSALRADPQAGLFQVPLEAGRPRARRPSR